MKNLLALVAFGALFSSTAFSQTKKIAHRSHSGKNSTFNIKEEGNFGLPSNYKTGKDSGAKKTTPDTAVKPTYNKKPVGSNGSSKSKKTSPPDKKEK